jgi:hypothetical protein
MAISYAMGETPKEILRHVNPTDPTAWTWKFGNQNVGPGTKVRSIIQLLGKSAANPEKLTDLSLGFGEFEYMRNPIIKFGRAMSSPAISLGWDLLSGKDYIGDPTRDGLLNFTETVAKRYMYIWLQSVLFEGGTTIDRASRGLAEFAGLRASPRNRIWEVTDLWRPDTKEYLDIPTDPIEIRSQGISVDRNEYRKNNPEVDAKLWITGEVKTLKTGAAASYAKAFVQEHGIDPTTIKAVKEYQEKTKRLTEAGLDRGRVTRQRRANNEFIRGLLAEEEAAPMPTGSLTPLLDLSNELERQTAQTPLPTPMTQPTPTPRQLPVGAPR